MRGVELWKDGFSIHLIKEHKVNCLFLIISGTKLRADVN